jgi:hypothetical protein
MKTPKFGNFFEENIASTPYNTGRAMEWDIAREWGIGNNRRYDNKEYTGRLPICPYGCGREGTLLEVVMSTDGKATGIFSDHPCTCIFRADIEIGEPPTKRKLVVDASGELVDSTD